MEHPPALRRAVATAARTTTPSDGKLSGLPTSAIAGRVPLAKNADIVLEARQLSKIYRKGRHEVRVLQECDFAASRGKVTAILGQSGSGKAPCCIYSVRSINPMPAKSISLARASITCHGANATRSAINSLHDLPVLSLAARDHYAAKCDDDRTDWPGLFSYIRNRAQHQARARALLERVGLTHRLSHKPRELSGGEMQRAAIARRVGWQSTTAVGDEPTGNLDRENGQHILQLLMELNPRARANVVMVTHDESIAADCDESSDSKTAASWSKENFFVSKFFCQILTTKT